MLFFQADSGINTYFAVDNPILEKGVVLWAILNWTMMSP
jgi:hypothetical protein